jgi:hypothetical protein
LLNREKGYYKYYLLSKEDVPIFSTRNPSFDVSHTKRNHPKKTSKNEPGDQG